VRQRTTTTTGPTAEGVERLSDPGRKAATEGFPALAAAKVLLTVPVFPHQLDQVKSSSAE
jgi:hypothetical protein